MTYTETWFNSSVCDRVIPHAAQLSPEKQAAGKERGGGVCQWPVVQSDHGVWSTQYMQLIHCDHLIVSALQMSSAIPYYCLHTHPVPVCTKPPNYLCCDTDTMSTNALKFMLRDISQFTINKNLCMIQCRFTVKPVTDDADHKIVHSIPIYRCPLKHAK